MNINKLIEYIDNALNEIKILVDVSSYYAGNKEPIKSINLILLLLKSEAEKNGYDINTRVLRATHDLGMSSYKDFENTALEAAINKLTALLYTELPDIKNYNRCGWILVKAILYNVQRSSRPNSSVSKRLLSSPHP